MEDGRSTTLSIGVRYDLEIIPIDETDNPLFPASDKNYPVDKNNISPRSAFTHSLDDAGKSVVRGGYGMFYNRTILGAIDDTIEFPKVTTSSNVVSSRTTPPTPGPPRAAPDRPVPGQRTVRQPRAARSAVPAGRACEEHRRGHLRFTGPAAARIAHQFTVGYGRELAPSMAVNADYVHMANQDMFLARNLNPMVRANTSRTGAITRVDAFGVLGEPYNQQVWVMENTGEVGLRRAQPLAREALLQQLVRARVVLAVEVARNGREPGRPQHLPVPDRS